MRRAKSVVIKGSKGISLETLILLPPMLLMVITQWMKDSLLNNKQRMRNMLILSLLLVLIAIKLPMITNKALMPLAIIQHLSLTRSMLLMIMIVETSSFLNCKEFHV